MGKGNNYDVFFKKLYNIDSNILKKIDVIFEIGSRDALDGITAHKLFNSQQTHIFECNQELIQQCKDNIKDVNNIFLCEKALYNKDNEKISFCFPVKLPGDKESWNGMGSLSGKIKKEYWINTNHPFKDLNNENSDFKTTEVETITLDTYCSKFNINKIDLILIDVEGIPLQILNNFENITDTKVIISEVYYDEIFENGNDTYEQINNYLESKNFKCVQNNKKNPYFGNAMWINEKFLK